MQAVIKTGGKQYKVSEGDVLEVERIDASIGDEVSLEALLVFDGADLTRSAGAVRARLVDEHKGRKVVVGKYKPKTGYRRKNGHRQILSRIEIVSIKEGSGGDSSLAGKHGLRVSQQTRANPPAKES